MSLIWKRICGLYSLYFKCVLRLQIEVLNLQLFYLHSSSVQLICGVWLFAESDCCTLGFPVHHQLPDVAQIHVHWVSDAFQPSHPLLSSSAPLQAIRVFSNESFLHIRWSKYCSFSFSINPSNEYSGLISFRIDWFDLLAVQGTLKSSLTPQLKSINSSAFTIFMVQLAHPYMTTGKTIPLIRWNFVSKAMPLLFNILSSWPQLFFQGAIIF